MHQCKTQPTSVEFLSQENILKLHIACEILHLQEIFVEILEPVDKSPILRLRVPAMANPSRSVFDADYPDMTAKKILLIGDEPNILRTLRRNLVGRGYDVTIALDDHEANLMTASIGPDLIVFNLDFTTSKVMVWRFVRNCAHLVSRR